VAGLAAESPWIEAPRFDLAVFFAPAALSLLAFVSCVVLGAPPLVWLWFWIICFDGPHMFATYSRVYGDVGLWRERKRLLLGSGLAFAVGPALLLLGAWLRVPGVFTLFLAGMSVYSFHHVVRQHWGFASLYGARAAMATAGTGKLPSGNLRFWFYGVCWTPYVAFILTHPSLAHEVAAGGRLRQTGQLAALGLLGFWLVGVARFARLLQRAWRQRAPLQQPAYLLLTALFHGLLFFLVARFEPVLRGAVGLDQEFMLLSVMNGMFHSAQYLGLVGLYHQRSARVSSGLGTWFANRPGRAWGMLLPFVLLYVTVACTTGVYPGCQVWLGRQLNHVGVNQLALGIWWGFGLHHYWLDERIWHVRTDAQLRAVFGLAKPRAP
jgi:hypothetical protein